MEIRTHIVTNEALQTELAFVLEFFNSNSKANTCAMLGIGCNIPGDEMYQEIQMRTDQLSIFVGDKIAKDVYHLGNDDLIMYDRSVDIEFTFCHEHDIHFESNDHTLTALIESRWLQMGYSYYEVNKQ